MTKRGQEAIYRETLRSECKLFLYFGENCLKKFSICFKMQKERIVINIEHE